MTADIRRLSADDSLIKLYHQPTVWRSSVDCNLVLSHFLPILGCKFYLKDTQYSHFISPIVGRRLFWIMWSYHYMSVWTDLHTQIFTCTWFMDFNAFLCPRHKMARGHLVFALSVLPSFFHSVPSKFVFSTPPTSLHGFEWNLVGVLDHKSKSACGEIIHVRPILAGLWSLTLRIFTHFSLSSQLLLHPCMDLNETWQGCCTIRVEVHVGR